MSKKHTDETTGIAKGLVQTIGATMTKKKLVVGAFAALLLAGGALAYWHWTQSPAYSFRQIQKAVEARDVVRFEQYVDLDSVSSRLVNDMMMGTDGALGLGQIIKPRLVELVREQAVRLVETGSLWSSPEAIPESVFEGVGRQFRYEQIGVNKDAFHGIEYIKKQGKISFVGLGFRNARFDTNLVLKLKLRDMGGYWQLVELANVTELLRKVKSLKATRLAETNETIRSQIDAALQIVHTEKKTWSDEWDIQKKVGLEMSIRNTSPHDITGFKAIVSFFDSGTPSKELILKAGIRLRKEERIGSTQTYTREWGWDANYNAKRDLLYELPPERILLAVEFVRVTFGDGHDLRVFQSLDNVSKVR